ncbi:hypothetical protein EDF46_2055 [Frondihabitans sp. PhB188]|uniref:DUF6457 domain-containing protein n=1 Tax=Frondihabitans sp. PhB188 TaxID=2485200 RepID=UPI000F990A4A|nr:DUF6457 domain-containing protein [Frondihabitans sp. PhB188]ROQ38418.1 hypothetical protein EDF46_2055 [Frondihabitans sp. PhB188]
MTETPAELEAWAKTLTEALPLPPGFAADIPAVLDLARDAAHGVARPAAPLTTFLVGLAAGLDGGSPEALDRAFATARRLATADPE